MEEDDGVSEFSGSISSPNEECDPWRYESRLEDLHASRFYSGLDKGCVDDNGKTISCCESSYLNAIMHDLDILVEVVWSEPLQDTASHELWHSNFNAVLREVDRLLEHPDLIADPVTRDVFFRYFENFCSVFEEDKSMPPEEDLVQTINARLRKAHLTHYDRRRVAWHQFLHHYAPGANCTSLSRQSVRDQGLRLIIPPAGIKLLRAWEHDVRRMHHIIYPADLPGTYRIVAKPVSHNERGLGGTIRYRLIGVIPGGPSFFAERIDPNFQTLETLTRDLARWEVMVEEALQTNPPPFMYMSECTEDQWRRWTARGHITPLGDLTS